MATTEDALQESSSQLLEAVTALVRLLRQAAAGPAPGAGGLSLTEFRLLKRLAQEVRLAGELAAEMEVTAATVSAAVDALVRRGLVRRHDSGSDRRAVPLAATEAGRAAFESARRRQDAALGDVLSGLRPGERRALRVAVSGLARVLSGARPS